MRTKLLNYILIGMLLGVVVGMALWWYAERTLAAGEELPGIHGFTLWLLDLLGPTLFIGALKMIVAPLIFASIVAGVTSLPNMRELGAIGWKTLAYYMVTTSVAVTSSGSAANCCGSISHPVSRARTMKPMEPHRRSRP